MKVKIGNYVGWVGPYQIAQAILFFVPKVKDEYGFPHTDPRVNKFGEWLAHGSIAPDTKTWRLSGERPKTWLYKFCDWVQTKRKRTVKVHIDRWDIWSMDITLAYIILPMLKQLKKKHQGAPYTDDEDVPEELRSTACAPKENEWDTDENHFKRWNWIMGEMIFAFESKLDDSWEDQFRSGEHDTYFERTDDSEFSEMKEGPNHTYKCDYEGMHKYQDRIKNGFRLFGKYYEGLWD